MYTVISSTKNYLSFLGSAKLQGKDRMRQVSRRFIALGNG